MTYIYERKQASDLFHDLKRMGRENFSYDGAKALMEYLEEIANDTGEPIEYDPIAYCCEYTEYDNLAALQADYTSIKSFQDLLDHTQIIPIKADSFIIQQF